MLDREILAPGIVLYRADKNLANAIVEKIKLLDETNWQRAGVVNTDTYDGEISESRICSDITLSKESQNESIRDLHDDVDRWVEGIMEDFRSLYYVERLITAPYILLRYTEGGKFDEHIDDGKRYPRTVSMSAYLNEDFEDGEIEFPVFNISHKPKTGDVVMFCSAFPYLHKVKPVKNGTRYTIVNWYRYEGYPGEML